jgi:2-dehydro-3-deoxyglucarate aldolase/4-hydroxy-2-oxoheptanedioate aldolase
MIDEYAAGWRSMARNGLLAKLKGGEKAFGTWIFGSRSPATVRMVASAGFDFVMLDMEHSDLSWETLGDMCLVARSLGITPVLRPYAPDRFTINRALDIGAMGIMVANVTSAQQVRDLRSYCMFPPEGERGSTAQAAPQDYIRVADNGAMKRYVNEHTLLAIQIESREGLAALEAILDTGGVDLVEVGREDLSTDLGVPLQTTHPSVLAAVDDVVAACEKRGVSVGLNSRTIPDAKDLMARGVRCINFSSDRRILMDTFTSVLAELQESR